MKKILAFTLSLIMVFSFTACNKENSEKYCYNCGEGISKDVAFCEHCGAEVNNEKTESEDTLGDNSSSTESKTEETNKPSSNIENTSKPTDTSKSTTSSKPSSSTTPSTNKPSSSTENTSKPTDTSKPSTPTHTHKYTNKTITPTCTEKGYTLHSCLCGDVYMDNYTNPRHSFNDYYICSNCGVVDGSHSYDYLVKLVKHRGTTQGNVTSFDIYENGKTFLAYDNSKNFLYVYMAQQTSGGFHYASVNLKSYFYGMAYGDVEVTGFLDSNSHTPYSKLTDVHYNGPSAQNEQYIGIARSSVNLLLEALKGIVDQTEGISMKNLGFASF